MNTPPPPREQQPDALPDYYLGMLLLYDELSQDNCRWIVYDGNNKIRCPTRKDAINYIEERTKARTDSTLAEKLVDARISLNHAINALDYAANSSSGLEQLMLQRLAVRLKPVLVDIDNIIIT